MTKLTKPQRRLLERVRANGEVYLNGRAAKTIKALGDRGLVVYDFALRPTANGPWTELWTVRPVTDRYMVIERWPGSSPCYHVLDTTKGGDPGAAYLTVWSREQADDEAAKLNEQARAEGWELAA